MAAVCCLERGQEENGKREEEGIITILAALASGARAQEKNEKNEKNEIGLVFGGTVTRGRSFSPGTTGMASFNSSLALGAEYDRGVFDRGRVAVYSGIDFLASPLDVKRSNPPPDVIGQYAYVFLTPHVRVKFRPHGSLSPWLLVGGGYARFRESRPAAVPSFATGTNTGTAVFGGGIDSRPIVRVFKIPIGFRVEVRDFYSGSPNYNQPVDGNQINVVFTGVS